MLAVVLQEHTTECNYLPLEQLLLGRQKKGCLDTLLVDGILSSEARRGSGTISVAWINYKKAFYRVPHDWLTMVLRVIRAPTAVRQCISNLLPKWKLHFSPGSGKEKRTVGIEYRRGLFQGDSLSPLLFCLCLAPLSGVLRNT